MGDVYGLMVHINHLELGTVDLALKSFLPLPSAGPPGQLLDSLIIKAA